MVFLQLNLSEEEHNKVWQLQAKWKLKTKSETVKRIIKHYNYKEVGGK